MALAPVPPVPPQWRPRKNDTPELKQLKEEFRLEFERRHQLFYDMELWKGQVSTVKADIETAAKAMILERSRLSNRIYQIDEWLRLMKCSPLVGSLSVWKKIGEQE